jgi:peptide/nickel transport system permease protein
MRRSLTPPLTAPLTALLRFLALRALTTILLVWLAASSMLLLIRLAPGDALVETRFGPGITAEQIERERARLGLDRPWWSLYGDWFVHAVRLDFGSSLRYQRPVVQLVAERAGNTAVLAFSALLLATLVGLPLGVIAGSGRPRILAASVRFVSIVALSAPPLLTSLILAWFAARTGWFPIGGISDIDAERLAFVDRLRDMLWHLALPVLALALPLAATFERLQADAVAAVRAEPFILGALARGVPHARVVWRDLWRAAVGPVVALYGLAAGHLLSGALAVELVSTWPGLGRLMFEALGTRDLPLAAGCAAAAALFLGIWTMVSDLALRAVDPRLREHDATGFDARESLSPLIASDATTPARITTQEPQPW